MDLRTGGLAPTDADQMASSEEREPPVPVGRSFWLRWVLASVATGTIGLAIMAESPPFEIGIVRGGDPTDTTGWGVAWAVILGGLLCGATLGGVQRWLLRPYLIYLEGWTLASTLGFTLAFTVVWALGGATYGEAFGHHALPHSVDGAGTLGAALLGAAFGVAQWLVLRRQVARAGWWVLANVLGFAASWALAAAEPVEGVPAHFVGGAIFGTVLGLLTGGVLLRLLPGASNMAGAAGPMDTGMDAEDGTPCRRMS